MNDGNFLEHTHDDGRGHSVSELLGSISCGAHQETQGGSDVARFVHIRYRNIGSILLSLRMVLRRVPEDVQRVQQACELAG